jgi:hypothetical protein
MSTVLAKRARMLMIAGAEFAGAAVMGGGATAAVTLASHHTAMHSAAATAPASPKPTRKAAAAAAARGLGMSLNWVGYVLHAKPGQRFREVQACSRSRQPTRRMKVKHLAVHALWPVSGQKVPVVVSSITADFTPPPLAEGR